ncbi:MAG: UDP-3-O-(3-hydroxymyristoyl)glucosamine N-acyltransferase, partial [Campylobacteraceae bacterium]|nr:UDP-3-O-(3-hydroxymyristoyl)glucosamine N-acyltransferase [Campylobacteraceae bacterium]
IGACTTVDRAVFGSTVIKRGTKIDNLVQIGHNCELGEHCVIVSQTGLAGSSILGRNVVMGGQSAASGHLKIGDFAVIAARGGVSKSLEGGKTYSGFPIMLHKEWLKMQSKLMRFFKKEG